MMGLSLVAIPVLLDTTTSTSHLLCQWARLYQLGIQLMPAGAIATSLLYGYTVIIKWRSSRPWFLYALAGAATMSIVPFTWFVMLPTNNLLFQLNSKSQESEVTGLLSVQELIGKWRWLHIVRSLWPLAGATLGLTGTLQEVLAG
jgi:hypothetical protein